VIRNPEAGGILRSMRQDLSRDITEFINTHAPNFNDENDDGKNEESNRSDEDEVSMFQIGGEPPSSESEYNETTSSSQILIDDSSQYTESLVLETDSDSQLEESQSNIETILLDSQEYSQDDSQG
jgi:glycerol-3-phosphate O-acyltransferase/dihydroxyacetone phosphate acyltransferase